MPVVTSTQPSSGWWYGVRGHAIGWPRPSTVTYSVVMNLSKTAQTSGGSVAVIRRGNLLLIARLAGQDHAGRLARSDDLRFHGLDVAASRERKELGGGGERRQLLEVLDRGKHEQDVSLAVRVERRLRREPAEVDALAAVHARLGLRRRLREEEVGVEADLDHGRCDPARELDQPIGVDALDRGLLGELAHSRRAMRLVAFALVGVHGAARE